MNYHHIILFSPWTHTGYILHSKHLLYYTLLSSVCTKTRDYFGRLVTHFYILESIIGPNDCCIFSSKEFVYSTLFKLRYLFVHSWIWDHDQCQHFKQCGLQHIPKNQPVRLSNCSAARLIVGIHLHCIQKWCKYALFGQFDCCVCCVSQTILS